MKRKSKNEKKKELEPHTKKRKIEKNELERLCEKMLKPKEFDKMYDEAMEKRHEWGIIKKNAVLIMKQCVKKQFELLSGLGKMIEIGEGIGLNDKEIEETVEYILETNGEKFQGWCFFMPNDSERRFKRESLVYLTRHIKNVMYIFRGAHIIRAKNTW